MPKPIKVETRGRKLNKEKKPELKTTEKGRKGLKTIKNENVFSSHVVSKVRKRLGVSAKELPLHVVRKYMGYIGKELSDWLIDNPEGFKMPYDAGYLAISKYVLIPFREERFEIVNKIKNLDSEAISERFREIILKKYGRNLSRNEAEIFISQGRVIAFPMWFNHRNCSFKKSMVWKWLPSEYLRKRLKKENKDKYYYLNFQDFYDYKISAMD